MLLHRIAAMSQRDLGDAAFGILATDPAASPRKVRRSACTARRAHASLALHFALFRHRAAAHPLKKRLRLTGCVRRSLTRRRNSVTLPPRRMIGLMLARQVIPVAAVKAAIAGRAPRIRTSASDLLLSRAPRTSVTGKACHAHVSCGAADAHCTRGISVWHCVPWSITLLQ